MLKKCDYSFLDGFYQAFGISSINDENYLGYAHTLGEALHLCRSHASEYLTFSLYVKINDESNSIVFLGCVGSTDF